MDLSGIEISFNYGDSSEAERKEIIRNVQLGRVRTHLCIST